MNGYLIAGISVVIPAMILYTIFIVMKKKDTPLTFTSLIALSLGLVADISSTTLMIVGSTNTPFTVHGFIGYTALAGMLVDSVLIWKHFSGKRRSAPISIRLYNYTVVAYGWWVVAFIVGAIMRIGIV